MTQAKVRYIELLPHEFHKRLTERPVAYLPLGTLEWHGEHLPLGSDAIISEGLMIRCARQLGGIVMPPVYLGPDRARLMPDGTYQQGMEYAEQTTPPRQLDGNCYWVPRGFFITLIDMILAQLKRAGFRAVFADGHGPSRWSWVENIPERENLLNIKLLGVTDDLKDTWPVQIDHAARNETSLMLALCPEWPDITKLPDDPNVWPQAVLGDDPRTASAEHGNECLDKAVKIVQGLLKKAGV